MRIAPLLLSFLLSVPALAAERHLVIEGLLRDVEETPLDGTFPITFNLYTSPTAPEPLWAEGEVDVLVSSGYFQARLGEQSTLSTELFSDNPGLWLGISVDGQTELPRAPLETTPYAFWAADAGTVGGIPVSADPAAGALLPLDSEMRFPAASIPIPTSLQCSGCIGAGHIQVGALSLDRLAGDGCAAGQVIRWTAGGFFSCADDLAPAAGYDDLAADDLTVATVFGGALTGTYEALQIEAGAVMTAALDTGSVTLAKLAADVTGAFLAIAGGALEGDLDLGWHRLVRPRIFSVQLLSEVPCDDENAGAFYMDGPSRRLAFCDGTKLQRLAVCTPAAGCQPPDLVACGVPVVDACGEETCGDRTGTACPAGQQCLDASCVQTIRSCKDWLAVDPGVGDGVYTIDIDGAGPEESLEVSCDMENGGWTQVLEGYDGTGNDFPDAPGYISTGWRQTGNGTFEPGAAKIIHSAGNANGALSPDQIKRMFEEGATALKFCFVSFGGADLVCRWSDNPDLHIVITPAPNDLTNSVLKQYQTGLCAAAGAACAAAYTYGRLAGLPGSREDYAGNFLHSSFGIDRSPGGEGEFGTTQEGGFIEHDNTNDYYGVWHGSGTGSSFRPWRTQSDELGTATSDVHGGVYGFRIYVR